MYFEIFGQMKKQLALVDKWFDIGVAYGETKKFDPTVLLGLRLAPDQFPLSRQVQIACDTVKLGIARVGGKEAPVQADTETTVDELRARITSVITYVETFSAKDFDGVAGRTVTQPRWEGKIMTAHDYLLEHVVPNFYFHLTHVYAILRNNGVSIGKRDYLGVLSQRLP